MVSGEAEEPAINQISPDRNLRTVFLVQVNHSLCWPGVKVTGRRIVIHHE